LHLVPEGVEPHEEACIGLEQIRPIEQDGRDKCRCMSMAQIGGEPCPGRAEASNQGKSLLGQHQAARELCWCGQAEGEPVP